MNSKILSRHAETRMRQRGVRPNDLEIVFRYGAEIGEDVYFLADRNVDRGIQNLKWEIQALERLRGQKVVVAGDTVVTCYRSRPRDQKRMLRTRKQCA